MTSVLTLLKTLLTWFVSVVLLLLILHRLSIPVVVHFGRLLLVPTRRTPVSLLPLTIGKGRIIR